jgi:hypothetical protein
MRWLMILALFLALPGWVRAEDAPPCAMPAELTTPSAPLTAVARALAAKSTVEILALGSGSTVGDSGGSTGPAFKFKTPGASFPYRMLDVLQVQRQASHFHLTVRGGRAMTADAMLALMRDELAARHYDLVIWQTGTVEAVRASPPDLLHGVLRDGVAAASAAQADVVLVDPQFSRFLRGNTDLGPYEAVLQQVAGLPGATLFQRFKLTEGWVSSGQVDLERASHDQRDRTFALLNTCLGHALARYVLTGAGEH